MFYVVQTDNFGGDYPNESFLISAENYPITEWTKEEEKAQPYETEAEAKAVADNLNEKWGEFSSRYCIVVESGYKLQPGFEP